MALSRIDTTNMIEDVPQSKLDNNINFRNIIINGDMSIAQRGTSFTGLGNGDTGYTTDRFRFVESGSPTYEFTVSQSTDVPTGQGFSNSLKFDCTTADTAMASGDTLKCEQWIEAQNLQYLAFNSSQAKSLTLSFWVRSNKTGTYVVWFYLDDATRQISKQYTISSADTWEKKTLTIPGDTSGSIPNDNGRGLLISWGLASGTDYTSGTLPTAWENSVNANRYVGLDVNLADSTSNEWYITGVQLEAGEVASDFEFLPHDVNKNRCLRYYYVHAEGNSKQIGVGGYYNSTFVSCVLHFPQEMRSAPSLVIVTGGSYYGIYRNNSIDQFDNFDGGIGDATPTSCVIECGSLVSGTAGHVGRFLTRNASSLIAFNSEL